MIIYALPHLPMTTWPFWPMFALLQNAMAPQGQLWRRWSALKHGRILWDLAHCHYRCAFHGIAIAIIKGERRASRTSCKIRTWKGHGHPAWFGLEKVTFAAALQLIFNAAHACWLSTCIVFFSISVQVSSISLESSIRSESHLTPIASWCVRWAAQCGTCSSSLILSLLHPQLCVICPVEIGSQPAKTRNDQVGCIWCGEATAGFQHVPS
jgi:hypothetical protein